MSDKRDELRKEFERKREENQRKQKEFNQNHSEVIGMDRAVFQIGFNLDELEDQTRIIAAAFMELSIGFSNAADKIAEGRKILAKKYNK